MDARKCKTKEKGQNVVPLKDRWRYKTRNKSQSYPINHPHKSFITILDLQKEKKGFKGTPYYNTIKLPDLSSLS